jgi:hypothetical protein
VGPRHKDLTLRTREGWLLALAEGLRGPFRLRGLELPGKLRISVSLTPGRRVLGVCYSPNASGDGSTEILVRIDQADGVHVAAILAHELLHAVLGLDEGHGRRFRAAAEALGLRGKMRATVPGERFYALAGPIVERLGPFPHAPLEARAQSSAPKTQSTRALKQSCSACGYTVRVTARWLRVGSPICPLPGHGPMTAHDPKEVHIGDTRQSQPIYGAYETEERRPCRAEKRSESQ